MANVDLEQLTETTRVTLEKTRVFSGLGPEVLAALRQAMQTRLLAADDFIYKEGEPSESIFVIRSGLVSILRETEQGTLELESRGPGDVVGESALIEVAPRYATAKCKTDTRVFELSRKQFFAVMTAYPQVAQHVLGVLSLKVRDSEIRRLRELELQTIELQRYLTDQQRLAIKGEMAAQIAHDLSNFIQSLGGFLQLAQRDVAHNQSEKAVAHLKAAQQSFEHVRLYADSLLYSEHPARKKQKLDLNDFIIGQLTFLLPQKKLASIKIRTDLQPGLPMMLLDPFGIQQVLYTLAVNAAEAMTSSPGDKPVILVRTRRRDADDCIVISFIDNGPGIEPLTLERMFRQRVSTKQTGHGFGLLNVMRIIADHGGTVSVGNLNPHGAEFTITLPCSRDEASTGSGQ